jgi:hypothetical protein
MFAIYSTPHIFNAFIHSVLVIPNAFEHAPWFSPVQAFLDGLSTSPSTDWYTKRLTPPREVFHSAIENLLNNYNAREESLHAAALYNPRVLQETRRLLKQSGQLTDVDFGNFGSHLIQDRPGLPLRYN